MSSYKFTPRVVASPDAPQRPLMRKRARSGGAEWVQVTRPELGSQAKKPCTSRSQPPACSHKEHAILTTVEATAFAAQFWDRKTHPTKASQHEFLAFATCIDLDVEKNVKYNNYEKYTIKRGHRTKYFVPYRGMRRQICKTQFLHYFNISSTTSTSPSPNPYISEMAFSCRFQKVYSPPPPRIRHVCTWKQKL